MRSVKMREMAGSTGPVVRELWRAHRYTALAFLCCLLQLSAIMTMKTTLALFIGEIGGSTLAAGMLLAIMVACSVAVKPVVGAMLDKSGAKPMMALVASACLVAVLSHLFALWLGSIPLALAGAVLAGIAYSTLSVTEIPLFTGQAQRPAQVKYMINLVGFNTVICTAIAPTFSQAVIGRWGFAALYASLIAVCALGFALFVRVYGRLRGGAKSPGARDAPVPLARRLAPLGDKRFLLLFVSYLTWGVSNGAMLSFLLPYGASVGVSNCSVYFTLYSAVNILFRWFVPACMNRFGGRRILLFAYLCLTLGSILLGRLHTATDLIAPAILAGLGTSAIYTPIVSEVMDCLPGNVRMGGLGIFLVSFEIGQAVASALIGLCASRMSYSQMFVLIGLIQGLGIFTVFAGTRRHVERSMTHT